MDSGRDVKLRRVAFGVALVLAAPLSVVSWLLVPASMVRGEEFVAEVGAIAETKLVVSFVTGTLFFPVAVIGILGLMHLLKAQTSVIATVGGGLAIAGLTLNTAALGAAGALAEAARSDLDPTESAALVEATIGGMTGTLILFGPLLAAVGTTILGFRLYRARTVPRLSAALLVLYGPVQLAGFAGEVIPVITLSYVLMTLAFIPVGLVFFKETDEEWESPATFEGFRGIRGKAAATALQVK